MGHFGQYNVPAEQLFLRRDRCFFVTEDPQFPKVTLTFQSKAGTSCKKQNILKNNVTISATWL